jgi:hypothetical protein
MMLHVAPDIQNTEETECDTKRQVHANTQTPVLWEEAVADLASAAAPNFPQAACPGLQKPLQQEWQFVQQVTKNIRPDFAAVEVALSMTAFLPTLFGDDCDCDDPRHDISCLPVKWAGLAVPRNPTLAANANDEASTLTFSHILAAFRGVDTF